MCLEATGEEVVIEDVVSASMFSLAVTSLEMTVCAFAVEAVEALTITLTSGFPLPLDSLPEGAVEDVIPAEEFVAALNALIALIIENPAAGEIEMTAITLAASLPVGDAAIDAELEGVIEELQAATGVMAGVLDGLIAAVEGIFLHTLLF